MAIPIIMVDTEVPIYEFSWVGKMKWIVTKLALMSFVPRETLV